MINSSGIPKVFVIWSSIEIRGRRTSNGNGASYPVRQYIHAIQIFRLCTMKYQNIEFVKQPFKINRDIDVEND